MGRFKMADLGDKKVVMAFDGSGWRLIEALKVQSSGTCPACGKDTAASPSVSYAVSRAKHKGKEPIILCTHQADVVEEARKMVSI